ncbi:MAG: hypothetical protein K0S07_469 [Chlamydiales bacterium]|nr:hypothetical protein [Chlamydiales bacterium]
MNFISDGISKRLNTLFDTLYAAEAGQFFNSKLQSIANPHQAISVQQVAFKVLAEMIPLLASAKDHNFEFIWLHQTRRQVKSTASSFNFQAQLAQNESYRLLKNRLKEITLTDEYLDEIRPDPISGAFKLKPCADYLRKKLGEFDFLQREFFMTPVKIQKLKLIRKLLKGGIEVKIISDLFRIYDTDAFSISKSSDSVPLKTIHLSYKLLQLVEYSASGKKSPLENSLKLTPTEVSILDKQLKKKNPYLKSTVNLLKIYEITNIGLQFIRKAGFAPFSSPLLVALQQENLNGLPLYYFMDMAYHEHYKTCYRKEHIDPSLYSELETAQQEGSFPTTMTLQIVSERLAALESWQKTVNYFVKVFNQQQLNFAEKLLPVAALFSGPPTNLEIDPKNPEETQHWFHQVDLAGDPKKYQQITETFDAARWKAEFKLPYTDKDSLQTLDFIADIIKRHAPAKAHTTPPSRKKRTKHRSNLAPLTAEPAPSEQKEIALLDQGVKSLATMKTQQKRMINRNLIKDYRYHDRVYRWFDPARDPFSEDVKYRHFSFPALQNRIRLFHTVAAGSADPYLLQFGLKMALEKDQGSHSYSLPAEIEDLESADRRRDRGVFTICTDSNGYIWHRCFTKTPTEEILEGLKNRRFQVKIDSREPSRKKPEKSLVRKTFHDDSYLDREKSSELRLVFQDSTRKARLHLGLIGQVNE